MSSIKSDTETRILEATMAQLQSGGGEAVRMSDIAKAAGISRQAVYLHFPTRAALLIAATHHLDRIKDSEARLAASRAATSGRARLEAFIEAWATYIPEIYGMAKAFLALEHKDAAAAEAWGQRMQDMWEGCEAAVQALARDGDLAEGFTEAEASDLLWTLLSVRNWELLTKTRGWSQARYLEVLQESARRLLVKDLGADSR